MERLTEAEVDKILSTRVQKVEFRSPMSCLGKCCPILGSDQFMIFIEDGLHGRHEQMISLMHEIAHIHFGVFLKDGEVVSNVPESIVEDAAYEYIKENPNHVNQIYERLKNKALIDRFQSLPD